MIDDDLWRPVLLYATALDTKQFDKLREVFHEDCTATYGSTALAGVEAIVSRMDKIHRDLLASQHRLTNFTVLERDGTTARTRTYVDALLVGGWPEAPKSYRSVGSYDDALTQDGERWMILSRTYRKIWQEGTRRDIAPRDGPA